MRKGMIIAVALLFVVALLLWAPWLSPQDAATAATEHFTAAWAGVIDGCGFNCEGCGATAVRRRAAGYTVELEYACGLIPADAPEFHEREEVYVSPLGTVHGLRGP